VALLLPTLGRAKESARAVVCVNNLKQVGLAWQMYPLDNNEWLVPNNPAGYGASIGLDKLTWARGDIRYGKPDGTNISYLRDAMLGPYLQTHQVFKCPTDRSETILSEGGSFPRVRTYAMNGYMGTTAQPNVTTFLKRSDFTKLSRPEYLVFVDEHEDCLDTCNFNLAWDIGREFWVSFPTSRHGGRGTLSYTDGHVELHRWEDRRTILPVLGTYRPGGGLGPVTGSRDWRYMKDRLTKGSAAFGDP